MWVTLARRDLPTSGETNIAWVTQISGALAWCLTYPPRIRRRQFIADLRKPPASWVSPKHAADIRALYKITRKADWRGEAERFPLPIAKSEKEQVRALLAAEVLALHARLPAKLKVRFSGGLKIFPSEKLITTLADFSKRLSLLLAVSQWYAKHRPRGRPSRDLALTFWVGTVAAVAHHIVMREMRTQRRLSPELGVIFNEFSRLEAIDQLKTKHVQRRGFIAYVVVRALEGAKNLRRLRPVAPLVGDNPDFGDIDLFDATYVHPYTRRLSPLLPWLSDVLRRQLLGPPGTLADDLGLRPKNAF